MMYENYCDYFSQYYFSIFLMRWKLNLFPKCAVSRICRLQFSWVFKNRQHNFSTVLIVKSIHLQKFECVFFQIGERYCVFHLSRRHLSIFWHIDIHSKSIMPFSYISVGYIKGNLFIIFAEATPIWWTTIWNSTLLHV